MKIMVRLSSTVKSSHQASKKGKTDF